MSAQGKNKADQLPRRVANDDGTVTVHLKHPIEALGEKRSTLTFKRPKAKHLRPMTASEAMPVGELLDLASRISGELPDVIDELEGQDLVLVLEVVGDFFAGGLRTGRRR